MAHNPALKARVRTLYIYNFKTLEAIAVTLDIALSTVKRWKGDARKFGDDWDAARVGSMVAGVGYNTAVKALIADFILVHNEALEALKTSDIDAVERAKALGILSHAFTKTMTAAGSLVPEISKLAIAQEVLKKLGDFIQEKHPQVTEDFLNVLDPFAQILAQDYDNA